MFINTHKEYPEEDVYWFKAEKVLSQKDFSELYSIAYRLNSLYFAELQKSLEVLFTKHSFVLNINSLKDDSLLYILESKKEIFTYSNRIAVKNKLSSKDSKNQLLIFSDLSLFTNNDIRLLLNEIDTNDAIQALVSADKEITI